jgi:hypothetical protein
METNGLPIEKQPYQTLNISNPVKSSKINESKKGVSKAIPVTGCVGL